jgi:hypothetical protein
MRIFHTESKHCGSFALSYCSQCTHNQNNVARSLCHIAVNARTHTHTHTHTVARSVCPIPSTSVTVGKLYSQFNKKLLEFLIASYIAYCDNFTAKLRSVRRSQRVARTGDTSASSCPFAGPCRQWQEELVEGGGG